MAAVLERIGAGALEKAVLARDLEMEATLAPTALVKALRAAQPQAITFAARRGDSTFLGATPEILFRRQGRAVRSVALAGSARRGASAGEDAALGQALLDSPKDRHEHALVVDAVAAALAPLCERVEVPPAPGLRRLRQLQHLETPLAGLLRQGVTEAGLLAALHPTPAVCGQPRQAARALLAQVEGFDRGWYAGPVGWLSSAGRSTFAVAIRSLLWRAGRARLFVGAGLVRGSEAGAEWRETELKSLTLRSVLEAAP